MNKTKFKTEYDRMHKAMHTKRFQKFGEEKAIFFDRLSTPWCKIAFKLLSRIALKNARVLEVGCGYGAFSIALAQLGARVVALDFSGKAVEIAKDMSRALDVKIDTIQGDAQNIPCPSSYFDVVVSCETLEHLPNFRKALAELYRCTKLGGYWILTVPNVLNPIGIYQRIASKQPFERSLTLGLMKKEITKFQNLRIMGIEATYTFSFLQSVEHGLPKSLGSHIGFLVRRARPSC